MFALVLVGCSSDTQSSLGPTHPDASNGAQSGRSSSGGIGATGLGGIGGTGGTNAGGATGTGGSAGTGGSVAGDGGSDAGSSRLCGSDPCTPTRCAGIGCGPAVCCHGPNGPVCIHGASECPAPDGGVRTETLACWSRSGSADFAKSCVADHDCFIAMRYTSCCPTEAVGLNISDQTALGTFETQCGHAPGCGCCCGMTTAEDGKVVPAGSTATVACVGAVCTTKAP